MNEIEIGRRYILWDGDCGFCRRSVEVLARMDAQDNDARSIFIIAPYQNFSASELRKVGLSSRQCAREVQIVSASGRTFGGAFAINYFLWQQPRWKVVVALGFLCPILFLIEALIYKLVAKNRMLFSQILFPKNR